MARRRRRLPVDPVVLTLDDLAHDGRGVGRHEDKVTFVHGALPGERVEARVIGRNRRFDEARMLSVLNAVPERVTPPCQWFDRCGGCALQHLDPGAQLEWKQHRLAENFRRIGNVSPENWLPPITGSAWGYRRRARLSVRHVPAKGRVLVGFREIGGRYVAEIEDCGVLHPAFGERLMSLSRLIGELSIPDRIPQVECASGDDSAAIVLRHLEPLSEQDLESLRAWSSDNDLGVWLQPGGPATVHLLTPSDHQLRYRLDRYDLDFEFHPQQFVQVNAEVNRQLVERAVQCLDPESNPRVLDLFCGLGNFSLPLARSAAEVVGVELDPSLVESAESNARRNGLSNARFIAADLQQDIDRLDWMRQPFDAVLLDPPRSGAAEVLDLVAATGAGRIVYVACDPSTLARDAGALVHEHGYRLIDAGIADMFPHTAHVESVAVFTRGPA